MLPKRVSPSSGKPWLQWRQTKIILFDVTEIQTFSLVPTIMKISICINFVVFWELLQNIGVRVVFTEVQLPPPFPSTPVCLLSSIPPRSLLFHASSPGFQDVRGMTAIMTSTISASQRFSAPVLQLLHLELQEQTFLQAAL